MRRGQTRPLRKRFLIVCEGTKTEPNYFEGYKSVLPQDIALVIEGTGTNTLALVQATIDYRDEINKRAQTDLNTREIDEAWVVFDKDDFPDSDFNNAINKSKSNDIKCAYSNEAFELWYILHFEYLNTGMNRSAYSKKLSSHLPSPYKKNSENMFSLLDSKQEDAIRNAKKLAATYGRSPTPAKRNPNTLVYKLITKLNIYRY
ncbi:MAG: RloB domain-containing protein [Candidatus Marinimicrobia bacterium]|nr:RloB domain-containing protein [Candidatus Neomarinimicrobiota bacterium]